MHGGAGHLVRRWGRDDLGTRGGHYGGDGHG